MKARDLIAKLQELDPETEVLACCCNWCEGGNSFGIVVQEDEYESQKEGRTVYEITGTWDGIKYR